jgi:hypothetical protein
MYTMTKSRRLTVIGSVPNRPAISNVLLKASANGAFRVRLLTDPEDALADMNLPPEDAEILAGVTTPTLQEFARQVKMRLMVNPRRMHQAPI